MGSHWVCNVAVGQTFMAAVAQYGLASVYAAFGTVALLGALYVSKQVCSVDNVAMLCLPVGCRWPKAQQRRGRLFGAACVHALLVHTDTCRCPAAAVLADVPHRCRRPRASRLTR